MGSFSKPGMIIRLECLIIKETMTEPTIHRNILRHMKIYFRVASSPQQYLAISIDCAPNDFRGELFANDLVNRCDRAPVLPNYHHDEYIHDWFYSIPNHPPSKYGRCWGFPV